MQFVFGNVSLPSSASAPEPGACQSEDMSYGGADGPGSSPQQPRRQSHDEGGQWGSERGYGPQRGGWRGRGGGGGDGRELPRLGRVLSFESPAGLPTVLAHARRTGSPMILFSFVWR